MGEVYAAFDPQLDRKVALKLLHETTARQAAARTARERLLREAKAIARLSHPNVVVVHDAGAIDDPVHGDRVFLAMEFIEGETLAAWLDAAPRSWREIRDVFAAAGEGLAAAHEAGLVHRDFKPQNVMVGRDGSVRVMDFGLASDSSVIERGERPRSTSPATGVAPTSHTVALTGTGVLLGTPLYMAPEQFLAHATDARTDQFSFCVALYEALYGERPFPSESFSALLEAVVSGRVREPAQKTRVPSFLRKLLLRGLETKPTARYASMRALLEVLRHDPIRRRRTFAIGAAVALVALVSAVGMQRVVTRGQRMCGGAAEKLAGIWESGVHWRAPRRHSPRLFGHRTRLRRGDVDSRFEAAGRLQPALDRDVHGCLRGDARPRRSVCRGARPANDLPRRTPRLHESAHRRVVGHRRGRAARGGQRCPGVAAARTLRGRPGASDRRAAACRRKHAFEGRGASGQSRRRQGPHRHGPMARGPPQGRTTRRFCESTGI